MALAETAGLPDLVDEHVTVAGSAAPNADLKVASLVAGMLAGADSIEDMDLVRHGGMPKLFTGCRGSRTEWEAPHSSQPPDDGAGARQQRGDPHKRSDWTGACDDAQESLVRGLISDPGE